MGIGREQTAEFERTGERIYLGGDLELADESARRHLERYRRLADRVHDYVGDGKDWLDIACGSGYGFSLVNLRCLPLSYTGVDVSAVAIAYARKNWKGADFVQSDAREFVSRHGFDAILCIETLEHLPMADQRRFLDRLVSFLRPGGCLGLSFPVGKGEPSPNPYHLHEPSLEEVLQHLGDAVRYWTVELDVGGTYGPFDQAFVWAGNLA